MKALMTSIIMISISAMAETTVSTKINGENQNQKPNLVEVVCRIKAKEAAAHAFRSCMLDDKAAQVQEMKKQAIKKIEASVEAQKKIGANEEVQKVEKKKLKPAMIIEDDTEIPEPTVESELE